jgi:hypothetical protein
MKAQISVKIEGESMVATVQPDDTESTSIEVLTPDGKRFVRINIFPCQTGTDIDVVNVSEEELSVRSWEKGSINLEFVLLKKRLVAFFERK